MPATPFVRHTRNTREDAQHMHLYVARQEALRVIDAEDGLVPVFEAYWLSHAQYDQKVANVMTLIEAHLLKLNTTKPKMFHGRYNKVSVE